MTRMQQLCLVSLIFVSLPVLVPVRTAFGQTQTPGQITQFGPSLNVVDSVITQDPSGRVGIGTTAPAAALDVAGGDVNLAGNILKGGGLFLHNSGIGNTFAGSSAGNRLMTGYDNVGFGDSALQINARGSQNVAIGRFALFLNTDGSSNSASGYFALGLNTTGSQNTAAGSNALRFNVAGNSNTADGYAVLGNNSSGSQNTANGFEALLSNDTGDSNTASGYLALFSNTTGSSNTAIGAGADVSAGNLTNATAIGAGAVANSSNTIRLGSTSVAVIEGQVPYTFTSDGNQKENFHPVDREEVLRKIGGLNVASWNYIGHDARRLRHYGPVAQEFFAAFGHDAVGIVGTPTTINSGDLEGILMIAVQALEKRTAENADLKARIEALERTVKEMAIAAR